MILLVIDVPDERVTGIRWRRDHLHAWLPTVEKAKTLADAIEMALGDLSTTHISESAICPRCGLGPKR